MGPEKLNLIQRAEALGRSKMMLEVAERSAYPDVDKDVEARLKQYESDLAAFLSMLDAYVASLTGLGDHR